MLGQRQLAAGGGLQHVAMARGHGDAALLSSVSADAPWNMNPAAPTPGMRRVTTATKVHFCHFIGRTVPEAMG